jgi:hypothetical protein
MVEKRGGHIAAQKPGSSYAAPRHGAARHSLDGISLMRSLRPLAALFLVVSRPVRRRLRFVQAQPDLTPPPQKPLDAKTQLETGRKY